MKFSIGLTVFTLLFATAIVEAALRDAAAHRRHVAHVNAREVVHHAGKRCKQRSKGHPSSSVVPDTPTTTPPANSPTPKAKVLEEVSVPKPNPQNDPAQIPDKKASGVINVGPGQCSPIGATKKVTPLSGPNGGLDWINCGITTSSGWNPPHVEIGHLITVSLDSARHTTFAACSDPIIATFEKYGNHHGIPPIMLASFAMQESSCNPEAVGGAGEQGLMQIIPQRCAGAPGGDCKDIDFNIKTGAEVFVDLLAASNGNVLRAFGQYNGWHLGMTYDDATSAAHTSCCRCQNNLDYVHQFCNGWLQGINAYEAKLGRYFNLDECSQ